MVLLGMLGGQNSPYYELKNKIIDKCYKIQFSKQIMKEYQGKVKKKGFPMTALQTLSSDFQQKNKFVFLPSSLIESKLKNYDNLKMPDDPDDNKFIEAAIASCCGYIVTKDSRLLVLDPYIFNHKEEPIRILEPNTFLNNNNST